MSYLSAYEKSIREKRLAWLRSPSGRAMRKRYRLRPEVKLARRLKISVPKAREQLADINLVLDAVLADRFDRETSRYELLNYNEQPELV